MELFLTLLSVLLFKQRETICHLKNNRLECHNWVTVLAQEAKETVHFEPLKQDISKTERASKTKVLKVPAPQQHDVILTRHLPHPFPADSGKSGTTD